MGQWGSVGSVETSLRFSWKLSICLASAALTASPVSMIVLYFDDVNLQAEEPERHSFFDPVIEGSFRGCCNCVL